MGLSAPSSGEVSTEPRRTLRFGCVTNAMCLMCGAARCNSDAATKLEAALNSLPGMSCQPLTGSMYAFPTITLPAGAIAAADAAGKTADVYYALQMLEATGIVMVPGSGFGQKDGTWHFRTTFLPPEDEMDGVIERLSAFHKSFMDKYSKEL
jgi:alanine transaminase